VLDRPGDNVQDPKANAPEHASRLVFAETGGEVITPGGSGVTVAPRALLANTTIDVEEKTDAPAPTIGAAVGRTFLLSPEGQTFDAAATVTLEIDPSLLYPGETARDVVIYTSPKASPSFSPIETQVVDATHVSAKTSHFSYFVPMHGTTVASIALANVGKSACSRNSKGGRDFESSCTGNGGSPEYWCADFARWVWAEAGANISGLTAAAGSFYVYGQDHGTLHHGDPKVGDAVVFNYQGGGRADHVAIVTRVDSGTIETVSGDWGGDSGSESFFSSTSHVVWNEPAYDDAVGTTPRIMGMTISGYISAAGFKPELPEGEYVSTAKDLAEAESIGDWKNSEAYVLGYFIPGAKLYAKYLTDHSVYGLIEGSGYGAWDYGHHCGWVPLGKGVHVEGSGKSSPKGDSCPSWDDGFSLADGKSPKDKEEFRPGSFVADGEVQPGVVLPTCSDFTVYANYDPATHTFSDPDGTEEAHRGTLKNLADPKDHCKAPASHSGWTPYVSESGVKAKTGYCGFGTRFVSADSYAVEIKDTERKGKSITAWGFMHADCIAGAQVGDPAGSWPPAKLTCGVLEPGRSLGPEGKVTDEVRSCNRKYWLNLGPDGKLIETQLDVGELWSVEGDIGDRLDMQSDGNLVLYSGKKAIWASHTSGHPGAHLALQDDGNLVVYFGATVLWKRN
jgi:cell wall-associated NlpC family hydrolase